jgi:predicted nuclease of predicted toxin-antitoxin system
MKLLFDQNLSPRLVERLSDLYPDSVHVQAVGLDRALDESDAILNSVSQDMRLWSNDGNERDLLAVQ